MWPRSMYSWRAGSATRTRRGQSPRASEHSGHTRRGCWHSQRASGAGTHERGRERVGRTHARGAPKRRAPSAESAEQRADSPMRRVGRAPPVSPGGTARSARALTTPTLSPDPKKMTSFSGRRAARRCRNERTLTVTHSGRFPTNTPLTSPPPYVSAALGGIEQVSCFLRVSCGSWWFYGRAGDCTCYQLMYGWCRIYPPECAAPAGPNTLRSR